MARFNKLKFRDKYGTMIMMIVFVLIITICLVLLFQKMNGLWSQMTATSDAITKMADAVNNMATRVGGGVRPV